MKVIVSPKFQRDLDKMDDNDLGDNIIVLIKLLYTIEKPSKIPNLKKMKGFKNAFRIIIGNYRVGALIENDTIMLGRLAHRKDIYNIFP